MFEREVEEDEVFNCAGCELDYTSEESTKYVCLACNNTYCEECHETNDGYCPECSGHLVLSEDDSE